MSSLVRVLALLFIILVVNGVSAQHGPNSGTNGIEVSLTPRISSATHFPFTGGIIAQNLNGDLLASVQVRRMGLMAFKSVDFEDGTSIANYLQSGLYYELELSEKTKLITYLGYVFIQINGFVDPSSDIWGAIQLKSSIGSIEIDNAVLGLNLSDENLVKTVSDRLKLRYSRGRFYFDVFFWARKPLDATPVSLATAASLTMRVLNFSERARLEFALLAQSYLTESVPSYAQKNGVVFSIQVPFSNH